MIQGTGSRNQTIAKFRKQLNDVFVARRRVIFLYPEGGFPIHLSKVNRKYAKKHNLPQLKHTVLPRVGAMKNILDALVPEDGKPFLDYVVDITLAYEKPWHFILIVLGLRMKNRSGFLYRVYRVADVSNAHAFDLFLDITQ